MSEETTSYEVRKPRKVVNTNRPSEYTEVYCHDGPGAGGMCHEYSITRKPSDAEAYDEYSTQAAEEPFEGDRSIFTTVGFQNGPIQENGVNGCHNEDLILIVLDRLRGAQKGDFSCRENALAITKLEEALLWLNYRTNTRVYQKVEGKSEQHDSP